MRKKTFPFRIQPEQLAQFLLTKVNRELHHRSFQPNLSSSKQHDIIRVSAQYLQVSEHFLSFSLLHLYIV